MYTRQCIVCDLIFKTKYVRQEICSEKCRIDRYKYLHNNKYHEEEMNKYLDNLKKFDAQLAQFKRDNPIINLPGGEVTIWNKPKFCGSKLKP